MHSHARVSSTSSIHLHVGDVDEAFAQLVSAGASVVRPLAIRESPKTATTRRGSV